MKPYSTFHTTPTGHRARILTLFLVGRLSSDASWASFWWFSRPNVQSSSEPLFIRKIRKRLSWTRDLWTVLFPVGSIKDERKTDRSCRESCRSQDLPTCIGVLSRGGNTFQVTPDCRINPRFKLLTRRCDNGRQCVCISFCLLTLVDPYMSHVHGSIRGGGVYWKFGEGRFVNCIRNLEIAFSTFLARHMSLLFALLFPIKQRKGEMLMLCANTCNKYVVRYGNFDLFNHLNCSFWDITHLWKFTNAMGKSEFLIRASTYKRSVLITASWYDMDLFYSVFIITGTILYTTRLSSAMQPC